MFSAIENINQNFSRFILKILSKETRVIHLMVVLAIRFTNYHSLIDITIIKERIVLV